MMPDILKQVGPQQYQFLKEQIGSGVEGKADAADDDDDDMDDVDLDDVDDDDLNDDVEDSYEASYK